MARLLKQTWASLLLTVLIVASGLIYLPNWIYKGYGIFRFENTWADVSCFFTEGYMLGFLFFLAPLLILATVLREVILMRQIRPAPERIPPEKRTFR
jgi:hypothetical protein